MPREDDVRIFRPGDLVWFQDENGTWLEAHVEEAGSSTCTMVVKASGDVVTESTKYIVPANPEHQSSAIDLCQLRYVSEPCIIHHLKQLSDHGSAHCLAGRNLCYFNNEASLNSADGDALKLFVHQIVLNGRIHMRRQCIRVLGAGHGGRLQASNSLINTLLLSTAPTALQQAVQDCLTILQAFGNASTEQAADCCRHCSKISFQVDDAGQMHGARLELVLMERDRVTMGTSTKDRLFHVLHLLAVATNERERHQLHLPDSPDHFKLLQKHHTWKPPKGIQDPVSAQTWQQLKQAFQGLGINAVAALSVVVGILWLGNVQFEKVNGVAAIQPDATLQRVTALLGCYEAQLTAALTTNTTANGRVVRLSVADANKKLNLLCTELYQALVQWLVRKMNAVIAGDSHIPCYSIDVCNIYEWDEPNSSPARLPGLLHNYANEALQAAYVSDTIRDLQDFFHNDGVQLDPTSYDHTCLELMDAMTSEPPFAKYWGVLPLMHDYSNMVGVSDSSLATRLSTTFAGWEHLEFDRLNTDFFSIYHTCGKVDYTFNGMLAANTLPNAADIKTLLDSCGNPVVQECAALLDNSTHLHPTASGSHPSSRPTMASIFLKEVKLLLTNSQGQSNHYLMCLNTNTTPTAPRASWTMLKSQVRRFNLRRLVQVAKAGHPQYLPFQQILDLFTPLLQDAAATQQLQELRPAQAAPRLLQLLGVPDSELFCGNTHVFFKTQEAWDRLLHMWGDQQEEANQIIQTELYVEPSSISEPDLHRKSGMSSVVRSDSLVMHATPGSGVVAADITDDSDDAEGKEAQQDVDSDLERELSAAVEDLVSLRVDRQLKGSLRSRMSGSIASSSIKSDIVFPSEVNAPSTPLVPSGFDSGAITPLVLESMHSAVSQHSEQSTPYATPHGNGFALPHPSHDLIPTAVGMAPLSHTDATAPSNPTDTPAAPIVRNPASAADTPSGQGPSLARSSYSAMANMSQIPSTAAADTHTASVNPVPVATSAADTASNIVTPVPADVTPRSVRSASHFTTPTATALSPATPVSSAAGLESMTVAASSGSSPVTGLLDVGAAPAAGVVAAVMATAGLSVLVGGSHPGQVPPHKHVQGTELHREPDGGAAAGTTSARTSLEDSGVHGSQYVVHGSQKKAKEYKTIESLRFPTGDDVSLASFAWPVAPVPKVGSVPVLTSRSWQDDRLTNSAPLHSIDSQNYETPAEYMQTSSSSQSEMMDRPSLLMRTYTNSTVSSLGSGQLHSRDTNSVPAMSIPSVPEEPALDIPSSGQTSAQQAPFVAPIIVSHQHSASQASVDSQTLQQGASPLSPSRTPRTPQAAGVNVLVEYGDDYISMSGHMELPPVPSSHPLLSSHSSVAQEAHAPSPFHPPNDIPAGGSTSLPAPTTTPFASYIPLTPSVPVDPEALRYRTLDDVPLFRPSQGGHYNRSTADSSKVASTQHTPDLPVPSAPRSHPVSSSTSHQSPSLPAPSAMSMPAASPWGQADLAARVMQDVRNSSTGPLQLPATQPREAPRADPAAMHPNTPTQSSHPNNVATHSLHPHMFTPSSHPEITPAESDPAPNTNSRSSPADANAFNPAWLTLDMPSVNDHSDHAVVIVPPPANLAHKPGAAHTDPPSAASHRDSPSHATSNVGHERRHNGHEQQPPHTTASAPHHPTPAQLNSESRGSQAAAVATGAKSSKRTAPKPDTTPAQTSPQADPRAGGYVMLAGPDGPQKPPTAAGDFVTQLKPLPEVQKLGHKAKWGKHPSPLTFTTELHAELLQTVSVVDDDIKFLQQVREGTVDAMPPNVKYDAEVADLAAKFERWKVQFAHNMDTAKKYIKQTKGIHGKEQVALASQELKRLQLSFESWNSRTKVALKKLQGLEVTQSGAVRFLPSGMKALLTR